MQISIWEQESFFAKRDVIIVGGGLAGLWCAYELLSKNPSLQLLIVDKGMIPAGASTRNAGFACFGSPTELLHDAQTIGEDRMLQLAEMRYKGIQKMRRVLGDAAIDYDDCGGYECLRNDMNNVEEIESKLSWLNHHLKEITSFKGTFSLTNGKLMQYGFQGFDALIENKLEGGIHSGKLVMVLQQKIQMLGGKIMQGITVERWEENDKEVSVYINDNISIKASGLFICTNALSQSLLPQLNLTPARGQVLVTTPVEGLAMRGTFHFNEGFYYFRNIGNRVLLGGARNKSFEEEKTVTFETTSAIQETLEQFLQRHILPTQSYKIEYQWSGIMGFTEDKQPLVKPVSARVSAIVICNGMGVALAPVIAEQIQFSF